jgi:hypothetical protein
MNGDEPSPESDQPPPAADTEDPLSPCYIFNMSEDVWPFISSIENETSRANEIAENAHLADREYLGFYAEHSEGGTFISPTPLTPAYRDYISGLFGPQDTRLMVTPSHSGRISADVASDSEILGKLSTLKKLELYSYCTSPEFYTLVAALRARGVEVGMPETPAEADWQLVSQYATKSGIRELVESHQAEAPWLTMPKGRVFEHVDEAVEVAAEWAMKGGVVLKTNKGHSGMGVAIFPPETGLTKEEWQNKIWQKLAIDNGFWNLFPVVLEEFIEVDKKISGGVPNVECLVKRDGTVEVVYYCGVRVLPTGVFAGVEIAQKIAPDQYMDQLQHIGQSLGELYAAAGYRGYFDADCLMGIDGKLYLGESNIRRTGGTYAHQVARRLLGADFKSHHYVATRMVPLSGPVRTFEQITAQLRSLLWNKETEEGVILASANLLMENKFLYIIVGNNHERALEIEQEMLGLVSG